MIVSLIAAMSKNNIIGKDGIIPWKIPGEQKRFKDLTLGKTIIMGRKSYEEIGRPLPGRKTVVISRKEVINEENCCTAKSLEEAFELVKEEEEIFIAGGGQLYKETMAIADRIYLTIIDEYVEGNVYFPEIEEDNFQVVFQEKVEGSIPYTYYTLEKVAEKGIPSLNIAKSILKDSGSLNPGPWVEHSIQVGRAARLIAEHVPGLKGETAEVLGTLHDIGRRVGVTSMRHSIDGYRFLKEKGYEKAARICITHSFPYKNIDAVFGKWDCSGEEYKLVEQYLNSIEFDDYDKLIQLCDALALPEGYCLIEKRIVDVAMRYGLNPYVIDKWKVTFEIQKYFEKVIGNSIYTLLPGVVENTFK
jgi:dihydrofolate reductase